MRADENVKTVTGARRPYIAGRRVDEAARTAIGRLLRAQVRTRQDCGWREPKIVSTLRSASFSPPQTPAIQGQSDAQAANFVLMAPSGLPQYAALPSTSTAALPKTSSTPTDEPTSEDLELDVQVYGPEDFAEETDHDGADGRKGLLSGREKGAEGDEDLEGSLVHASIEDKKRKRSCVSTPI